MECEWQMVKLGDVCTKIGSGATPRGGKEAYFASGVPLIRSQNVHNNRFLTDGLAHINGAQAKALSNVVVETGDVLLNITGDSVARVCQAPAEMDHARVNQHVAIVRGDSRRLDNTFLRFWLVSPKTQQHLLGLASSGGTRNALTKQMIAELQVPLPPLYEQHAIASILGALDDKIEVNRQMNRTLEEMARAIFKSWFVDFDPVRAKMEGRKPSGMHDATAALFPDSLENSELGPIPKGWRVGKLGEICEFRYGKALKEEDRAGGDVPVYGSNGRVGWHSVKLSDGPGIIVGRKGNAGTVVWSPTDFFAIDTAFYVVPSGPIQSMRYLYEAFQMVGLAELGSDSAVPGLNRNIAYMSPMLVPSPQAIDAYDQLVEPFWKRQWRNESESTALGETRDALLPKLMSGEICVMDAERFMEEADV